MSALFSHAIRWEWTARNPITSVRQSAKRLAAPDVLTPEELANLAVETAGTASHRSRVGRLHGTATGGAHWTAVAGRRFRESDDSRSPLGRDDGGRSSENRSLGERCSVRRNSGGIPSQTQVVQPLQQASGLAVCLATNERQATVLAGRFAEEVWSSERDESRNREKSCLSYVHDRAYAERRRRQGGARTSTPREQCPLWRWAVAVDFTMPP